MSTETQIVDRFHRCRLLFGENYPKIENAKILIFGVGGVGSFCLDALYRTGIQDITIVDDDVYDVTNQNRQIGSDAVGESKVLTLAKLYKGVKPMQLLVTKEWIDEFDFSSFDVIIDAIDDIPAKVALAHKVSDKLVSSMGGAKRIDVSKIEISTIWKTKVDAFARKIRYELKKSKFKGNYPVVYSTEEPNCIPLGSFEGVTGSFGLAVASLVVQKILKEK
ncbi:MAG: ThiF family adenylyltransferase [Campylobacteraceae bacterium]